ncbi:MAG: hypothetical protein LBP33_02945, partial [Candidatus Adiutrix sp.]|nr:hypothetical protein [Candidatus Adiutrix sp.]
RGPVGDYWRETYDQAVEDRLKKAETIILGARGRKLALLPEAPESEFKKARNELKVLAAKCERLEADLSSTREQLRESQEQNRKQDLKIKELASDAAAAWTYNTPTTAWEACEEAARLYSSRLIIHPRVKAGLEGWVHNRNLKCATQAMIMLKALALELYDMKFSGPDGRLNPKAFQDKTGIPLAMTEGRATKRDQAFEDIRTCEYQGRELSFFPHLKAEVKKVKIRLHFDILEEDRKIVVCHLGDHLPNSQTRYL